MEHEYLYLKPNIQAEPLVDRWYAWPHLIPPATAARNITNRHLPIMESYIASPEIHAAAVRNPQMLGGPFIDHKGERIEEIKILRDHIITQRSTLITLSKALDELDRLLKISAAGQSLEPLYAQVPDLLRGYVELIYDLNDHASYRLIEPLIYRSNLYDRSQQSFMLSTTIRDDRPFILSTPRLESPDSLHIPLAFGDSAVDKLFHLKTVPARWPDIESILPCPTKATELVRSWFTTERPEPYRPYQGATMRWRYFGHACILLEYNNLSILFDPVLSYTYESDISRYTYADLPDIIDYVLITHDHQDHVLFETLLQIRHKVRHIIVPHSSGGMLQDPSMKLLLENCGFENVRELREMESISEGSFEIVGLPFLGEHGDLAIQSKLAWFIRVEQYSLLFAADSCNLEPELYRHLRNQLGPIDALFIGMECNGAPLTWLYGPLFSRRVERQLSDSRRGSGCNYDQAVQLVEALGCQSVYVYAMGQEPWLNYIMSLKYTEASLPIVESNRLLDYCRRKNIPAERLFGEREMFI